ncbi:hypothetical protein [Spiroplasma endosymbiont of Diplazon laetatorius]|uniref:hypothetical protein n=1 Tax=Spiroplasma endosymbiont of Diplazon laetatorius TaxID=3066322 RepID=UPI0030D13C15
MKNFILGSKTLLKMGLSLSAISVVAVSPLSVVSCQKTMPEGDHFDRPVNWYSPYNSVRGNSDAFANDSCSILWDEEQQLFYSWMLFRDNKGFPSGWIEMTSPDLNKWTQGKYRIKQGEQFNTLNGKGQTSALGGSVWVDTEGKFFEPGDVVFVLSMQPSVILNQGSSETIGRSSSYSNDKTTDESGIAYFVSHGLGQDFYTSGVLSKECLNKDGTMNWRDTAVFETDDGVYFAISANNRLEFWKINHFGNKKENINKPKIEKVNELFVRNIGVEVPNVVRMGENLWYVSASVQDNPFGGPFQSSWYSFCEWDKEKGFTPLKNENGKFTPYNLEELQSVEAAKELQKLQPNNKVLDWKNSKFSHLINPWTANEYGTEGYAQRVVNLYQTQEKIKNSKSNTNKEYAKFAIARSMTSNWAYDTDIWTWKGGSYGSEKIELSENGNLTFSPYDKIAGFSDNGTAVYQLKGKDLENGYDLFFNNEKFTFKLQENKITWENNVNTGLKKWTKEGGPADLDDDIIIVWNKCTLTFYDKTKNWNAHFMLPQKTVHKINSGAKSIV